jgi:hypothetical protein
MQSCTLVSGQYHPCLRNPPNRLHCRSCNTLVFVSQQVPATHLADNVLLLQICRVQTGVQET